MENGRNGRTSRQVWGEVGAVSTANPLASEAARTILADGGSAVDAAVGSPGGAHGGGASGLRPRRGRDRAGAGPGRPCDSFHGAGRWSEAAGGLTVGEDGSSVTVPGAVRAWELLVERYGRCSLAEDLAPAVRLAEQGFAPDESLLEGLSESRVRLERGGAAGWSLVESAAGGSIGPQPELARTLRSIGDEGPEAFYRGPLADAMIRAVRDHSGALTTDDLASHVTREGEPLEMTWGDHHIWFARPPSQAILLGIALRALERFGPLPEGRIDHLRVEAILGAFRLRDRVMEGDALLEEPVPLDVNRAGGATGPRPFLHTAGVSVAAADGLGGVVARQRVRAFRLRDVRSRGWVHAEQPGGVLHNAPNDAEPGKLPVHTLSPILVQSGDEVRTLATPGADGQVQSLLQVLTGACRLRRLGGGDGGTAVAERLGQAADRAGASGEGGVRGARPPDRGARGRGRHVRLHDERRTR